MSLTWTEKLTVVSLV